MVERLNCFLLPAGYFAETQVHVGNRVEVDVASFEFAETDSLLPVTAAGARGMTTWVPPAATFTMPAIFPDEVEIEVFQTIAGATLVGAIELISPRNKDRAEARRAFAAKCASYLQEGIGLVIVDVVTERHANLHDELIRLLEQEERFCFPAESLLYAVAYHPLRREPGGDQIDIWPMTLAVGQPLPTVPLALRGGPIIPLDLELTYGEARQKSRL
jgi:hypothetical protein